VYAADQAEPHAQVIEYDHVSVVIAPSVVNLWPFQAGLAKRPKDCVAVGLKPDPRRG
jgi:hypothetical protein